MIFIPEVFGYGAGLVMIGWFAGTVINIVITTIKKVTT